MTLKIGDHVTIAEGSDFEDFIGTGGTVVELRNDSAWPYEILLDGTHISALFAPHEIVESDDTPSGIRTFTVYRRGDISATHDANTMNPPDEPQFFGVIFPSGKTVINWDTASKSVSVFDSYEDLEKVHLHLDTPGYETEIVFDNE